MNELIIEKAASSLNENHSDSTSKTFSKTPYKKIGKEKSEKYWKGWSRGFELIKFLCCHYHFIS